MMFNQINVMILVDFILRKIRALKTISETANCMPIAPKILPQQTLNKR